MALIDGYYDLTTKVRKDPLGHSYLNSLLSNQDLLTRMFGAEHYLSDDVGSAGEHNVREIPRAAAVLTATGGPPATGYSINNPDGHLAFASMPETGECRLTLAAGQGTLGKMSVQLQSYLPSTLTSAFAPHLWAHIASATDIRVYTQLMISLVGVPTLSELWAPLSSSFGILVYSEPTQDGGLATSLASAAHRGIGLRNASIWNKLLQRDGDLRSLIGVAHNPDTGTHDDLRIPKALARIVWNGSAYEIAYQVGTGSTGVNSVTTLGTGAVQVNFDVAYDAPLAPFVTCDYQRTIGGDPGEIFTSACPSDLFDGDNFQVCLYRYDQAGPYWNSADTDFWLTIHGA